MMSQGAAAAEGAASSSGCLICWLGPEDGEDGPVVAAGCGHSFHSVCLNEWKIVCVSQMTQPVCPCCRQVLVT
jgi:hypothetical protein